MLAYTLIDSDYSPDEIQQLAKNKSKTPCTTGYILYIVTV